MSGEQHNKRYAIDVGATDASTAERDAMQTRAETATVSKKVSGMDGPGWAAWIRTHPGCTLPPGAGSLVVEYFDSHFRTRG